MKFQQNEKMDNVKLISNNLQCYNLEVIHFKDSLLCRNMCVLQFYCFQLSIVRNQLLRMYGVSKLHNLVTLNLANNGILTIEGIKDMINLQTLCLAGNNIKVSYTCYII